MDIDHPISHSRRKVLGALLGTAAAAAAAAATPATIRAADGDNAVLGAENQSTSPTSFENADAGGSSLIGSHAANAAGVVGRSGGGVGVQGISTETTPTTDFTARSHRTGVFGQAGNFAGGSDNTDETGVYGFANLSIASIGVWGESKAGTGVFGSGSFGVFGSGDFGVVGSGRVGVIGDVDSTQVGVYGHTGDVEAPAPPPGVGVYARAATTGQSALVVSGKVKFSRSGRTSLGSAATSRTITMTGVTTSSYVVATMQTDVSGVYVRSVVPASGSFTIHLSKAAGKTVVVGYLVIN
jgi:hypothetical protein